VGDERSAVPRFRESPIPHGTTLRWALRLPRRFVLPGAALVGVLALGTAGYVLIEGMSAVDALYLTAVTVSTVGYGDIVPVTREGKLFTVALIMTGVGTVLYLLTQLAELVIEGQLREVFGRSAMRHEIEKLRGHVIVCGYGRFGKAVVEELMRSRSPLVILDSDGTKKDELVALGVPYFIGSALSDETLEQAGLDRARAIVVATPSDSDNVFITLSARERNSRVSIHARAESESGARRLRLAGAHQVISAYQIGGARIASSILRPAVVDFLEISTLGRGEEDVALEEIRVAPGGAMVGRTVGELETQNPRLRIVALKREGEPTRVTPAGSTRVDAGDYLVVIGERGSLEQLAELAGSD
jgi:voltage-gated potassium channel